MTIPHTPSFLLPSENPDGSITLLHNALSEMLTHSFHLGRINGVQITAEAVEELFGSDDEGDILAAIAPALAHVGISEMEVSQCP